MALPEGKVLIPGVLDTTNFIEHPELVPLRITNCANVVGRENVMTGSDCSFGTSAWGRKVETSHRVGQAGLHVGESTARL